MTCENCGQFWSPGQNESVQDGGSCPNCGTRPYMNQPNPVESEMTLRDMPNIDMPFQPDQGGNPLSEGSFGASQPSWRRDESYASVIPPDRHSRYMRSSIMEASEEEFPFHVEQVIPPGPKTVEVDMGGDQPLILQNKDQNVLDQARSDLIGKRSGIFSMLGEGLGGLIGSALGPEGTAAGAEIGGALGTGASVVNAAHTIGGLMNHVTGGGDNQQPQQQDEDVPSDNNGLIQQPGQTVSAGLARMAKIVHAEDYDSPNSVSVIPQKEDTGDPEDVDPHELNDGTHDTWQKENDIDGARGSNQDTYAGFDPLQSHGIKMLEMTLPLIRHYHEQGPGSGKDDPLIQALDAVLEAELPGYKDHPENADPDLLQAILGFGLDDHNEDPTSLPNERADSQPKDEAGDRGSDDDWDSNDIEKESSCPNCRTASTFPLGMCPGCGLDIESHIKTAGGPENPEQFKAVADLLRSQGREQEIPELIDNPDAFSQELLEIQHQQEINPPQPQGEPQPPMPEDPGDQAGAGMPMPPPPTGQQPMASVRTALKPIKCPKCDSHTTSIQDSETGYCRCHTCGHTWDANLEPSDSQSTHHNHSASVKLDDDNPTTLDAADQDRPDVPHGNAATMSWVDSEGAPLEVGKTYLVYSPKYRIPDRQTITGIKPNSYVYEQTGEYGIPHANEISKQEANMDALQFVRADEPNSDQEVGAADPGIEENNDYAGDEGDPGQQTDLSNSQEYRSSSVDPNFNPSAAWLLGDDDPMSHTAGKNYTSWEQRELINEPGVARNLDKLNLSQTHYDPNWDRDADDEFAWL